MHGNLPQRDLGRGVFVGRTHETAVLRSLFNECMTGSGNVALLTGEPGIGKTRTIQEVASEADQQTAMVLWSRCYESSRTTPYWPWVQLIRTYSRDQDPEKLRGELGTGAADVAEIVPELRDSFPELETPPSLALEQARLRLFDSIVNFFKRMADTQPVVLVLDDLHWADQSSLLLLEFAARELQDSPLLVVGAYRDVEVSGRHPLALTLGELAREPAFHQLHLVGLKLEDVQQYVRATVNGGFSEGIAEMVFNRSEGNPFFMRELVALLVDRKAMASADSPVHSGADDMALDWSTEIPEGVREAILTRLHRLSPFCHEVLIVASVIAREFELAQLRELFPESSLEAMLASLEEASAAGVIEEVPRETAWYRFTYALVRQTISNEVSAARRGILHGEIGAAMERLNEAGGGHRAAELAHHFADAATLIGPAKLIEYSAMAASEAMDAYAYEEAISHVRRALEAGPVTSDEDATASLLFILSRAQAATLEIDEAVANLARAFNRFVESGNVALAVKAVDHPHSAEIVTRMTDLIPRALALVPGDSSQAGRILSSYGFSLGHKDAVDAFGQAQQAFSDALAIARREGDPALEMRTLANHANISGFHNRWHESLEFSQQALSLISRVNEPISELRASLWAFYALFATGRPEMTQPYLDEMASTAGKLRDRYWLFHSTRPNLILANARGDWTSAREIGARCLKMNPGDLRTLAHLAHVEYETGDFDRGNAYIAHAVELTGNSQRIPPLFRGHFEAFLQLVSLIDDDIRPASLAHFFELSGPSEASASWPVVMTRVSLALGAIHDRDESNARDLHDALSPLAGTATCGVRLSVDRLLAGLSALTDDAGRAASEFESAMRFCQQAGYRPELAWTAFDYASMLVTQSKPGNLDKARELLKSATELAADLDMMPLGRRLDALRGTIGHASGVAPEFPDGLTSREVQVLRLIAGGQSNRRIAEELVISFNTVMHHVSHILGKTHSANRTEAAVYAARQGLLNRCSVGDSHI